MPVVVRKQNGKYRVVEKATGEIAKNSSGTAVDGGGHNSADKAVKQAAAINQHLSEKRRRT